VSDPKFEILLWVMSQPHCGHTTSKFGFQSESGLCVIRSSKPEQEHNSSKHEWEHKQVCGIHLEQQLGLNMGTSKPVMNPKWVSQNGCHGTGTVLAFATLRTCAVVSWVFTGLL
jgi:hypothetical protein